MLRTMPPSDDKRPVLRTIFDTNVVLDCFAFEDPLGQILVEQIVEGRLLLLTRDDLRDELMRVLTYEHLPFDDARRSLALERYDPHARAMVDPTPARTAAQPLVLLPRCRDPDDQKFLEAARDARADLLLSKDKALLELARSRQRPVPFRILTPQAWLAAAAG
jgi:putative PIN family toxin of toxin-antitoxin system